MLRKLTKLEFIAGAILITNIEVQVIFAISILYENNKISECTQIYTKERQIFYKHSFFSIIIQLRLKFSPAKTSDLDVNRWVVYRY